MKVSDVRNLALRVNPGYYITNIVKYENYYIAFMQPNGINKESEDALMDCYTVINGDTGKVEYKSIYSFKDFFKRVKIIE